MANIDDITGLSSVSRWVLAFFSVLFGLIMVLWALGQEPWKLLPAAFCFVIAGACVLPQPIKGWCGTILAGTIICLAVSFFYASYQDPHPGSSPLGFALGFGLPALAYLVNKYGRSFDRK